MSCESILWVPASVSERLAQALRDGLSPWAAAWGLPGPDELDCVAITHAQAAACMANEGDLIAVDPSATVHLVDATEFKRNLAQRLLQTNHLKSPMAAQVLARALESLQISLAAAVNCSAISGPVSSPCASVPGHWGLQGSACLGDCRVQLLLPMTVLLANGWLRRSAPSALPRWKAETVLAALPLRFVAHLGQANVEVGDLASLDVGDVLLLSQTSKDPMQLLAIDTDLQLNAHLGAHGTHRAAQLMASPRGAAR